MRALNTAGRAVLFAAATVIIALLGLLVLGVSFLNGVAVGAALDGAHRRRRRADAAARAAGLLRHAGALRKERRRLEVEGPHDPKAEGTWPKIAAFVQRHAKPLVVAALVVMLVLTAPVAALRLGSSDAGTDPPASTTRKAYDLLASGSGRASTARCRSSPGRPTARPTCPRPTALAAKLRASRSSPASRRPSRRPTARSR